MNREDKRNNENGWLSLDEILDLAAKVDMTRHYGGIKATNEVIELCHVDSDKLVLDVGCGRPTSAYSRLPDREFYCYPGWLCGKSLIQRYIVSPGDG